MKIAVTYENGQVYPHFGHTEQFLLLDTESNRTEIVPTEGAGHGALAAFLQAHGVTHLICGGIGAGAQQALQQAGIKLYGGVSGDARAAAEALVAGTLAYNPDVRCSHHDHEGSHGCGHGEPGSAGCRAHHHGEAHQCRHGRCH